jgi:hypothetical protein
VEIHRLVQNYRDQDGRIPSLAVTDLIRDLQHHMDATVELAMSWGIQEGMRQEYMTAMARPEQIHGTMAR